MDPNDGRAKVFCLTAACLAIVLAGCSPSSPDLVSDDGRVHIPSLSVKEKARLAHEAAETSWAAIVAAHPNAERPSVEFVRFVLPNEWAEGRVECLAEYGIAATIDADGGVAYRAQKSQEQSVDVANYACDVMYPMDPVATQRLNESQVAHLYNYYIGDLSTCLRSKGVPVTMGPSLAVFAETLYGDDSWSPYAAVADDDDWEALNRECPQTPDGLYGE